MFNGFTSELGLITMAMGESVIMGESLRVSLSTEGNDFLRSFVHCTRAASSSGEGVKGIVLYLVARAAARGGGGLGLGKPAPMTPRARRFCQLRMHEQKMSSHTSVRDSVDVSPS